MTAAPRIVLIHATRVAMDPIEAAFRALWPEAQTSALLDEALAADLDSGRVPRAELDDRILRLADYARGLAPDAILFTCSSFGTGIERAARRFDIPVLKPNEAMFEAALAAGRRIAMLYTFAPAAEGMAREFGAAAGCDAQLIPVLVPGALAALQAGDTQRHHQLVAEAGMRLTGTVADAVMLAHFSMSGAAGPVRAATPLPVLTSPETAIARLRQLLGRIAQKGPSQC